MEKLTKTSEIKRKSKTFRRLQKWRFRWNIKQYRSQKHFAKYTILSDLEAIALKSSDNSRIEEGVVSDITQKLGSDFQGAINTKMKGVAIQKLEEAIIVELKKAQKGKTNFEARIKGLFENETEKD